MVRFLVLVAFGAAGFGGCGMYHRIDALPSIGANVGPGGAGFSMRSAYEVGPKPQASAENNYPGWSIGPVFSTTFVAGDEGTDARAQLGLGLRGRYYFLRRTGLGTQSDCYDFGRYIGPCTFTYESRALGFFASAGHGWLLNPDGDRDTSEPAEKGVWVEAMAFARASLRYVYIEAAAGAQLIDGKPWPHALVLVGFSFSILGW